MKKEVFLLAIISILCMVVVYADGLVSELGKKLVRLHVISNSDTPYDLAVKYAVRDEILKIAGSAESREEIARLLPELEKAARRVVSGYGAGYGVRLTLEKVDFPRKSYSGFTLPSGNYTTVRAVLGSGGGENWWCVVYPPLCFTEQATGKLAASGEATLKSELGDETFELITADEINCKFKLVELVSDLRRRLEL